MLARAAGRRLADFNAQELANTAWALSQRGSLRDAWSLFEHAKRIGISCSALLFEQGFEALLLECKQRGVSEYAISFLKTLEDDPLKF